jgi:hypothetical protein
MVSVGTALRKRLGQFIAGRSPTPRPRPFAEMGTSGTAVHGGYIQVKERSPEWIGRQKYVTSSELAINTSIVAAGVHYFLNLVAYPEWTFRATDEDDEESLALAEFAENVVKDMDTPWYKVVRRAAMYRFHGFGIQEWTAKHRDDGLIGFKDIEARPQQTIEQWDVDIDGSVLGVWQRSPQTGALLGIPRDKVLYLVEDTLTDSPEGIGMFRHMADPYMRLKQMQQLEIRAYERDLRGTPIARAPLTYLDRAVNEGVITQAEADRLVSDFEGLVKLQVKQSDTGLMLDSLPYFSDSDAGDQVSGLPQWNFELLQGGGVGHAEVAAGIDRLQREIARIIGVEHLMMGDTGGNRALSEDKSRNLYLIANSVLKYIASSVKKDILVPLWKLNGFPMKKMPEPKPEDVTFKNVDAITNAIGKMASAGAVLAPNDPVINDVRDLLGVSRVPDDVMAAGAMPQNPMLAGLPPELQGGGGAPQLGGGGPGKQPGMGGGGGQGFGGFDPAKKHFVKYPSDDEWFGHVRDEEEDDDDRDETGGRKPDLRADVEADQGAVDPRVPGDQEATRADMAGREVDVGDAKQPRGAHAEVVEGKGQPRDASAPLGSPNDPKEDEQPKELPGKPGVFDIQRERQEVKATVDEPPQLLQVSGQGALPDSAPKADGAPKAEEGTTAQIDLNGDKPGGNVEVPRALLIQLLEHFSGKPAVAGKPTEGGVAAKLPDKAGEAEEGKDKPTEAVPADQPAGKPGEAKPGDPLAALAAAAGKPGEAKPEAAKVPGAEPAGVPPAAAQVGEAKKPGAPEGLEAQGKTPEEATTAGALPGAEAISGKPPAMAGDAKTPVGAEGVAGKPKGGKPLVDPKTGEEVQPGQLPVDAKGDLIDPVDPKTGQPTPVNPVTGEPALIDPATGKPVPGTAPNTEPEMTPERASEILQPYADYEKDPEEEEPKTMSDVLWSRLGEEKDVGPVGTPKLDPVTGEPMEPDLPVDAGPAGIGGDEAPAGAVNGLNEDPVEQQARQRLRERFDAEDSTAMPAEEVDEEEEEEEPPFAAKPKPKAKPKGFKPRERF